MTSTPTKSPTKPRTVDAEAWARALDLAEGDARRLDVRDPYTVVVLNGPRR